MTRQWIIEAAGRRFKTDGIDSSGIAALMADVGLTNGALYAHLPPAFFPNRNQMIVIQ
ncbi:hypothetical protein [Streptomyces canus]|uniref:hypothetical protein n=1 Tax=Streptomyces canus TaxID=58343 RepID=UPI003D9A995F